MVPSWPQRMPKRQNTLRLKRARPRRLLRFRAATRGKLRRQARHVTFPFPRHFHARTGMECAIKAAGLFNLAPRQTTPANPVCLSFHFHAAPCPRYRNGMRHKSRAPFQPRTMRQIAPTSPVCYLSIPVSLPCPHRNGMRHKSRGPFQPRTTANHAGKPGMLIFPFPRRSMPTLPEWNAS